MTWSPIIWARDETQDETVRQTKELDHLAVLHLNRVVSSIVFEVKNGGKVIVETVNSHTAL